MDYEKKYKEAIERAKEMIKAMTNIGGVAKVDDIQYLFPELKESEDEKFFKTELWHISHSISNGKSTDCHCDTTDWLKNLKGRVQPKQEWSEEDKEMIEALNMYVKQLDVMFSEIKIGDKDILAKDFRENVQNWLKSLRPQNRWKPSDEQMQILHWCMPLWVEPKSKAILESLINDLKKLREESYESKRIS